MSIFTEFAKLNQQVKKNNREKAQEQLKNHLMDLQAKGLEQQNKLRELKINDYGKKVEDVATKNAPSAIAKASFVHLMNTLDKMYNDPNVGTDVKEKIGILKRKVMNDEPFENIQQTIDDYHFIDLVGKYGTQNQINANKAAAAEKQAAAQDKINKAKQDRIDNNLKIARDGAIRMADSTIKEIAPEQYSRIIGLINDAYIKGDIKKFPIIAKEISDIYRRNKSNSTGVLPKYLDDIQKKIEASIDSGDGSPEEIKSKVIENSLEKYTTEQHPNKVELEKFKEVLRMRYGKVAENAIMHFENKGGDKLIRDNGVNGGKKSSGGNLTAEEIFTGFKDMVDNYYNPEDIMSAGIKKSNQTTNDTYVNREYQTPDTINIEGL